MCSMVTVVNNSVYLEIAKKIDFKSCLHKKMVIIWPKGGVSQGSGGDHFAMISVSNLYIVYPKLIQCCISIMSS